MLRPYYVYFIERPDVGQVKIGISKDIAFRLKTLQLANGAPLVLRGSVLGGSDAEESIHEVFADDRQLGEWFRLTDELRWFIDGLCGEYTPNACRGRSASDQAMRQLSDWLDRLEYRRDGSDDESETGVA